ncbi:MAG: TonB-dependent receptor [Acidobacteria bacterium]|nr:TonB-dependent receptor [Acidobacteriota bacterium]
MGASASIGLHAELGAGNALVANVTRSYRAPAIEELYNFGAHVGTLSFDVGNPDLDPESTVGLDLSLRHRSDRVRADLNFFVYNIDNFIFGNRSGAVIDNLPVFNYLQGDSRFTGFDARGSTRLAGRTWLTLGLGYVDARLTTTNDALPRIPPLRGTVNLDIPYGGFTLSPQVEFAGRQADVFRGETETEGYSVVNLRASYVWPRQYTAHILSFTGYNLTNALYRNHTSFIKDLAPEMGRGVRLNYSVRFH